MSRQDEITSLIARHNRRLRKLKEQQAIYGTRTDPAILIEIEDIEAKLAELQSELQKIEETMQLAAEEEANPISARLFISYKRHAHPDEQVAVYLQKTLSRHGHQVFIDQTLRTGDAWMEEIDRQLKQSDFLIVLLSENSADSEMVKAEVSRAYEYRRLQGKPLTLPVRLAYEEMLPYSLATFLNLFQYVMWQDEADNEFLAQEILAAMAGQPLETSSSSLRLKTSNTKNVLSADGRPLAEDAAPPSPLPMSDPRFIKQLPVPGGAVKLNDKFYVERDTDAHLKAQLTKRGTTTTIRAPRQTGKTSLLMRGIHHAREQGAQVIFLDFQSFEHDQLASLDVFLEELAWSICDELELDDDAVTQAWQGVRSTSKKLLRFMEKSVLSAFDGPIVLAMDEADSLLRTDFYKDFFGLLRSWHNRRAAREIWERLNLVLVISTEPYLLIDDIHQSPFNVGLHLSLADFDAVQVEYLNRQHGTPVTDAELIEFMILLQGHPFLTRQALYKMAAEGLSWATLNQQAIHDHGPFGDHLRHQYWLIRDKPALQVALAEVIRNGNSADEIALFRLQQAGLVKGSGEAYQCRCDLYRLYFEGKLLR